MVGSEQDVNAIRVMVRLVRRGLCGARGKLDSTAIGVGERAQPAIGVIAKAVVAAEARKARRCNMGLALA